MHILPHNGSVKGEIPVFARLWPVRVRVRVSFTTGALRSAILATAGLLVLVIHIGLHSDESGLLFTEFGLQWLHYTGEG